MRSVDCYFTTTRVLAIMSCRACLCLVNPAMMYPIANGIRPVTILAANLPVALPNVNRSPNRSVTMIPMARLPSVACASEDSSLA